MPRIEFVEHIDAPPQAVWDFISDIRRAPEWVTVMKEVLFVSDESIKQGSVYRERSQVAGSTSETEWRITEFDPPRRQVHETNEPMLQAVLTMEVTPDGDGTRLMHRTDFNLMPRVRPLGWLVEKLFGYRMMSKALRQTVDNAKRSLESEDGSAPPR